MHRRLAPFGLCLCLFAGMLAACSSAPSTLAVALLPPREGVQVRGPVTLEAEVFDRGGALPERLELREGDAVLATLEAPPWRFAWSPDALPEGAHELHAVAVRGAEVAESAPLTLTVDRTAPCVISQHPTPGDANVAAGAPIEIAFSEPLRPGSVLDSTVLLAAERSVPIAKTLALSLDGRTLTITPLAPVTAPAELTVALTPGLVDLAGNPLASAPLAWSWKVPAWRTVAEPLPPGTPLGLAFDVQGRLVVASLAAGSDPNGSTYDLRAWRLAAGRWDDLGIAATLSADGWDAVSEAFALDAGGEPVFAFSERKASTFRVSVRRRDGASGSWSTVAAPVVLDDGVLHQQHCTVEVALTARRGTVRVAIAEVTGAVAPFFRVLSEGPGGWVEPAPVVVVGQPSSCHRISPRLEEGDGGTWVVAYARERTDGIDVIGMSRWTGAAWATAPDLDAAPGNTPGGRPELALWHGVYPMVAWAELEREDLPGQYQLHARWYVDVFDTWFDVAQGGIPAPQFDAGNPGTALAIPETFEPLVVVPRSERGGYSTFGLLRYKTGLGWRPVGPRPDVPDADVLAQSPRLALDPSDVPYVAFSRYDGLHAALVVQTPNE